MVGLQEDSFEVDDGQGADTGDMCFVFFG